MLIKFNNLFAGRFKSSIISTSILLSLGTVLARLLGFIRDIFIAKYFGVSSESDVVILILTFPDIVISLLMGTAAGIVFVPKFQSVGKSNRWRLLKTLGFYIFAAFTAVSMALFIGIDSIVHLLAPGLGQKYQDQASLLLGRVVWVIPLFALTHATRTYLQAELRFLTIALEGALYNLIIVLGLIFFTPFVGLMGIVVSMFLGFITRLTTQIVNIVKTKPYCVDMEKIDSMADKQMVVSYLQAMGGGLCFILIPVIARSFGSYYIGDGFISIFSYSQKIGNLPTAITIVSLSTVMLPKLSKAVVGSNNIEYTNELVKKYITSSFLFSFPMAMSLIWLFCRIKEKNIGLFDLSAASLDDIYLLTILCFVTIPIQAPSTVYKTIISAKKDMKSFLLINLVSIIVFIPVIAISLHNWRVAGVGIGSIIICVVVCIMEGIIVSKKYKILVWNFLFEKKIKVTFMGISLLYAIVWIVFKNIETTFLLDVLMALALGGISLWIAFPAYFSRLKRPSIF